MAFIDKVGPTETKLGQLVDMQEGRLGVDCVEKDRQ